ncbi:MAG: hypothetical protein JSR83_08855 [Proteobacteria bacterium]|nr:hypothetical protein [Pseudomonadota bacterium]
MLHRSSALRTTSLRCSQQAAGAELAGCAGSNNRAGHPRLPLRCSAVRDGPLWAPSVYWGLGGLWRRYFSVIGLRFAGRVIFKALREDKLPPEGNLFGVELNRFILVMKSLSLALKKFILAWNRFKSRGRSLSFVLNRPPSELNWFNVERDWFSPAVTSLSSALKQFRWKLNRFKSKPNSHPLQPGRRHPERGQFTAPVQKRRTSLQ